MFAAPGARSSSGAITYPGLCGSAARNLVPPGLMAYRGHRVDVGRGSETRRVQAALASSNYFAVLGAGADRRTLLPEEERHALGPSRGRD